MRLAIVSSSFVPSVGSLERQVDLLARALARHEVKVDVLTQDASLRSPHVSERDGIRIRRFPNSIRGLRSAVAPGLWNFLRRTAASWDVVHLHSSHGALGLAVGGVDSRRLVFTPHVPIQRLLRWPYGHAARVLIERAAHTVALSDVEAGMIRSDFPRVADRVLVVPAGVDVAAIQAASPVPCAGDVVLAIGRLERCERLERAIAATAGLDQRFRLVIVGGGAAGRRLRRYAEDLRVAHRVYFTGPISGAALYRWLRTARVLVTLSELDPSGFQLLEALRADASVVASDIPAHRELAAFPTGAGVRLVSPGCSPLQLADAIAWAAAARVPRSAQREVPSAEASVEKMLPLYRSLTSGDVARCAVSHDGTLPAVPAKSGAADRTEAR